jgi:hypothetical protein
MSQGGWGSEKCPKSVTYYLNGPKWIFFFGNLNFFSKLFVSISVTMKAITALLFFLILQAFGGLLDPQEESLELSRIAIGMVCIGHLTSSGGVHKRRPQLRGEEEIEECVAECDNRERGLSRPALSNLVQRHIRHVNIIRI